MKKTISNVRALKIPRKYFCTEGVKVAGSTTGEASNVSIHHIITYNYIFLVVYSVCLYKIEFIYIVLKQYRDSYFCYRFWKLQVLYNLIKRASFLCF